MRRRFGHVRLAAALAVVAVSLVGMPARAAVCPAHVPQPDLWTQIAPPAFPDGPRTMRAYDSADLDADHLVATNGVHVATTLDGGCTWTVPALPDRAVVPDVAVGEATVVGRSVEQVRYAAGSAYVVWAIGQTDVAAEGLTSARPRVLVSEDAGRTFAERASGLPPFARPVAVRGTGRAALLLLRVGFTGSYAVYATSDAGATWTERWNGLPAFADLTVDPTGTVWLWSSGGLWRAVPGGEPVTVPDVLGPIRTVDVGPGTVTAYVALAGERFVSGDLGATFRRLPGPEDVMSASSHVGLPGLVVTSSDAKNVLVHQPGATAVDFSPRAANVSAVQFVQTLDARGFPLYAFNPLALYRRVVPFDFVAPPAPPVEPPIDVDVEIRDREPVLRDPFVLPRDAVVELRPGQRRTVDFRIGLPPVPTPLDVFFMTDSTGSMEDTIVAVQEGAQGIIDGLVETGVDVEFGVADFRDHRAKAARRDDATYPYRLRRETGPIDTELEDALGDITTGGGSADGHDSGLEATYQAVTGAGRLDPITGDVLIQRGQDADFRPGATKVLVVATDDNFRHPDTNPGYPGPARGVVSKALREAGVYFVGIVVDTDSGSAREDMEVLAADSGAVAPAGGIDCDADTQPDLDKDEPLVCDFDPEAGDSIAQAIVAMLRGIRDEAPVDVAVVGGGGLVRPTGVTHFPRVNVREENHFTVPVEFACPRDAGGTESTVRVAATVRGRPAVGTGATLRCVAPDRPPVVPPAVPPLVVVGVVPAVPAPPAPVSNGQPNLNPNVNPNPNPNPNPNAGMAAQEDRQFQLALADNELTREDLAMTGLSGPDSPVPALAWAAAFAMTGAAAFGLHLRRRAAPRVVRVRR